MTVRELIDTNQMITDVQITVRKDGTRLLDQLNIGCHEGIKPRFPTRVPKDEKYINNFSTLDSKMYKDAAYIPKIHPAQKSVKVLKRLIETFTDEGDVVIDPCCGSGATLRAARELNRSAFGFEIDRTFYTRAKEEMLVFPKEQQMNIFDYMEA